MTDTKQKAKTSTTGKFRTRLTGLTMYNLTTEIRKVGMAGTRVTKVIIIMSSLNLQCAIKVQPVNDNLSDKQAMANSL